MNHKRKVGIDRTRKEGLERSLKETWKVHRDLKKLRKLGAVLLKTSFASKQAMFRLEIMNR